MINEAHLDRRPKSTFVDLIQFADDVQAYFRELVLEEVEEKR